LFEPSSRNSFPALEQIPPIILPGDGRLPTAKPFSPTLSDLAAETGATAVSVPEAVRGVDLMVVTRRSSGRLGIPYPWRGGCGL